MVAGSFLAESLVELVRLPLLFPLFGLFDFPLDGCVSRVSSSDSSLSVNWKEFFFNVLVQFVHVDI